MRPTVRGSWTLEKATSVSLSRTTSELDLLLELPPRRGRRTALEQALRGAIRDGRLTAGTALPSTRVLAHDLGIARSTVSEAYAQLSAAGYLTARQGSGTWVAPAAASAPEEGGEQPAVQQPRFDLRPGVPDLSSFPRLLWQRALRRALSSAGPDVFAPADMRGRPELRAALADYLARARGVATALGRLVVCNGFSQGLKLLCDVLSARGARRIAIEDPSLWLFPPIARAAGLEPVPVPVDREGLAVVLELPNGVGEQELLSAAGERELEVHGLAPYRHGSYEGPEALVVGYGAPAEHAFPGSLRALASLLRTSVAT